MTARLSNAACRLACVVSLLGAAACGDDGGGTDNPEELITTVILELTPTAGGATVTVAFDDPDGDGGDPPVIDPLTLAAATSYTAVVRFQNRLEIPPEEITDEVRDEAEDHQVFFTGTAVTGPASEQPGAPLTHAYADLDGGGLPVGLTNTITTTTGTGVLTVTLRHLPPINGEPTKTSAVATQVRDGGFAALAGESDAQVNFMTTVP